MTKNRLLPYGKRFYMNQGGASLRSAEIVVPLVLKVIRARSVVDVGCGIGGWLSVFSRHRLDICGIDGEHVPLNQLLIPSDRFTPRNLEEPLRGLFDKDTFDLAVSLEVAEHLLPSRAESFVEDLVTLAPVVLFSAAVPHQGGTRHLNEQWQTYWAEKFAALNYATVDIVRDLVWAREDVEPWYKQNLLLYVRRDILQSCAELKAAEVDPSSKLLNKIHPELWLRAAAPRGGHFVNALARVKTIFARKVLADRK